MKLRCTECGLIFEENELNYWTEPHGEGLSGCPKCHGTFEEIEACRFCGEYEDYEEDLQVCKKCSYFMRERLSEIIAREFSVEERKFFSRYYEEDLFYEDKKNK